MAPNESSDDFQTRLLFAAQSRHYHRGTGERATGNNDRLRIATAMLKAAKIAAARAMAAGEPFRFVIGDTLQAYFVGRNPNNPAEILEFIRSFRPITELPGKPTTLLAAHPVKNAARKIRGADFDPIIYKIEMETHPDVADVNGALLLLPLMRPGTDNDSAAAEDRVAKGKTTILVLLLEGKQPNTTTIAAATRIPRATVGRYISRT